MWIQVRLISGSKTVRIDNLSKLTKVEELRKRLVGPFEANVNQQRLFFRGKQVGDTFNFIVTAELKTAVSKSCIGLTWRSRPHKAIDIKDEHHINNWVLYKEWMQIVRSGENMVQLCKTLQGALGNDCLVDHHLWTLHTVVMIIFFRNAVYRLCMSLSM